MTTLYYTTHGTALITTLTSICFMSTTLSKLSMGIIHPLGITLHGGNTDSLLVPKIGLFAFSFTGFTQNHVHYKP